MKFASTMKSNGELAVRKLSEKAQNLYYDTDPLSVYEYTQGNETKYAYNGCLGDVEGLSF